MMLTISLLSGWAMTLAWAIANSRLAAKWRGVALRWRNAADAHRAEADALHDISREIEKERDALFETAQDLSAHVIQCHEYVRALHGTTEQ